MSVELCDIVKVLRTPILKKHLQTAAYDHVRQTLLINCCFT